MDIYKILTICVICLIIGLEFVLSLPTFGNEYVHIKVHIPQESSHSKKPKHSVVHHVPHHHVRHKVIHHYHHRKPVKKVPPVKPVKETTPVLEHIYLADLDKPHHVHDHAHGSKPIEETYLVTEEHRHSKPIEEVKTIKVIEEYKHQPKTHVKTIKLIETSEDHHPTHHHLHEDHEHHIKTVKFIEEKPKYHPQTQLQIVEEKPQYHPQPQLQIVEEKPQYHPPPQPQPQQHHYYPQNQQHQHHHVPQVEEVIEEEHTYHAPQTNTFETKTSLPKGYYKNNDAEDQILHGIIEESLEIIKTKQAKNNNYQTYYGFHPPKEQTKPQEQYHQYQGAPIEEQVVEYETPAANHNYAPHQHYGPPKQDAPVYEKPESNHNIIPHQHYGAPKPDVPEYEELINNQQFTPHQHYGPPKQEAPEYEQLTGNTNFAPHQQYGPPNVSPPPNYQEDKQTFAGDYEKFLPSSESPQDFNNPHNKYEKQNTLYDDLNPKDDFSNSVENPQAPETYTGYDSYSAGHVQGIGSGGYRHHGPLSKKKK